MDAITSRMSKAQAECCPRRSLLRAAQRHLQRTEIVTRSSLISSNLLPLTTHSLTTHCDRRHYVWPACNASSSSQPSNYVPGLYCYGCTTMAHLPRVELVIPTYYLPGRLYYGSTMVRWTMARLQRIELHCHRRHLLQRHVALLCGASLRL